MIVKWLGLPSVLTVFLLGGCGATTPNTNSVAHVGTTWSPVKVTQRDLMPVNTDDCMAVLSHVECGRGAQPSAQKMREAALDNLSDNFMNRERRPNRIKQSRVRLKRDRVEWQYKF